MLDQFIILGIAQIHCDCSYDFNFRYISFNTPKLTVFFKPLTSNVSLVFSFLLLTFLIFIFSSFDTPEDANVAKALGFFKKTTFHF